MNDIPTWRQGARDAAPILLGVAPFGLIFGVTAAASDLDQLALWASSLIIFAGASQLAIVEVLGTGGAAITALLTAIVINSRHLMYSADMGRYTSELPVGLRARMAYVLTDQAYLVTATRFANTDGRTGLASYYFGAALSLWTTWQITTTSGFLLGNFIPQEWRLEFAIPMVFLALLVFSVKSKPGLVAAVVGGTVAVLAVNLDYQLGLMIGATAGILSGLVSERWFA
jgi:predicted branched-subunit amino acid permease